MAHIIGTVSLNRNVYSLRDIAGFEHISSEKIESLMSQVLKKSVICSGSKSSCGVQAFFNEIGVNDANINMFLTHTKLRPFAYAIRLETEKCRRGSKEISYAMFYVPKAVYEDWRKKRKAYSSAAVPDMSEYGLPKIRDTRSVAIKKCPEFSHFEKTVKSLGFKVGEAVMVALMEYMERHRDVFGEIPRSPSINENNVRENRMSLIFAYIDPDVTSAVFKVLQRYNAVSFPHVKLSEFVEAALREKLNRLPVRYTDPALYADMLALEKAETEFIRKGDDKE